MTGPPFPTPPPTQPGYPSADLLGLGTPLSVRVSQLLGLLGAQERLELRVQLLLAGSIEPDDLQALLVRDGARPDPWARPDLGLASRAVHPASSVTISRGA